MMYHIFCFTDWMPDLVVRNYLGYSVTACILIHLFFFIAFSLRIAIRAKISSMKRKKILKIAKLHANKQKVNNRPKIAIFIEKMRYRLAERIALT